MVTKHQRRSDTRRRVAASHATCAPNAEALALRLAEGLSRDASRNPIAHTAHLSYVSGAIYMAAALGHLTDARALRLRESCGQMLAGVTLPAAPSEAVDGEYARLVLAVRRHGGATPHSPDALAQLGLARATEMLARMQNDGLLHDADMWGFYAIRAGEA